MKVIDLFIQKKGVLCKFIIFCFLLIFVTKECYSILVWKDNEGIRKFYAYDENIMDIIVYGSSHAYCTVNTALMWEDYGYAAYNMGESGQNIGSTYYYIEESLKYQTPKLIIVELRGAVVCDGGLKNGNLYRNTLGLRWSDLYLDNMSYAIEKANIDETELQQYKKSIFFKYMIFHSRYDEITKEDFQDVDIAKGRYVGSWTTEEYEVPNACSLKDETELTEEQIGWLDKIVELTEQNDIELIFFVAPYVLSDDEMRQYNSIKKYCEEKDIAYFNFNEEYEMIGFDYAYDLQFENHNGGHLNNCGAEKVTRFLGRYIYDNYDIPCRYGDDKYSIYEQVFENWETEENTNSMD